MFEGSNDEHFHSNVVLRSCAEALKTFMLAMVILKLQEVLLNGYCGDALRGASVKNKKAKTGKVYLKEVHESMLKLRVWWSASTSIERRS